MRLEDVARGVAHGQYQYVEVTFSPTANGETVVRHQLFPATPYDVDYQVVGKDRTCDVYDDRGLDSRPWGDKYIVLKCTVASAKVTLLLTTRR